jgi:hypothetical protein
MPGTAGVYESNPIAAWWLASYGWGGLVAYKLAILMVVGGLVAGIARWRPRTGELILVFACGAQSTVVLYSLFLTQLFSDPEADFRSGVPSLVRFSGRGLAASDELFQLLTQKAVQEDLHLAEARLKQIAQLVNRRQMELPRAFLSLPQAEWQARVDELMAEEKALLEGLEPGQVGRLRQIALQRRGPSALAESDVAEALQLTAEQKQAIQAVLAEPRNSRPDPFRGRRFGFDPPHRFEEERTQGQILALLTPEQRARWKEMIGEPFRPEPRPWPGMPRGPSFDPRRMH